MGCYLDVIGELIMQAGAAPSQDGLFHRIPIGGPQKHSLKVGPYSA